MINFIKNILENALKDPYPIIEGKWADSYTDPETIEIIKAGYKARWMPQPTPYTHPALFDPFNPPKGWRYDPFYEEWIKTL
jgi:hypothetical protein